MKNYNIKDDTITVTQLNKLAKTLLENNMPVCWISGEISGVKTYSHIYFDLKDDAAKISCVMFASVLPLLDFKLENGLKVEIRGKVTIYPQNGSYQINVERIRRIGLGELWEAYNRLLVKLRTEGLFDSKNKKPIPVFPKSIGVVTSKEGAVIRDVITTLRRRMPNIPIVVYHTAVQGQDAAMQITKAIRTANIRAEVDVLIVCRGGGSMEDLWCFNEEVVVREVFASHIPIISAIGHETDTTIIDFVSDLRAPTPTGAAELVAKSKSEWDSLLARLHYQLLHKFEGVINDRKQSLDSYYRQLKILNPINQLYEKKNRLRNHQERLLILINQKIATHKMQLGFLQSKLDIKKLNLSKHYIKLDHLFIRLDTVIGNKVREISNKLDRLSNSLSLVNPANILKRGYAIVRTSKGQVVYQSKNVKQHERVEIILSEDNLSAIIDKKYNSKQSELDVNL
ncbi:MAG: exodeoxyribonuclease VII large subunit [Proteobacteria bacterium]|jgi:exodeoxyribonuclease VII large subunit|nr:exodeoxyribonuclease VII large subunit [Pseudomonadota bacterium]